MVGVTLVVVRHGATDWSDAGRFNGWSDVSLNERGRGQAAALRDHLRPQSFAGVWSSDLSRAVETARHAFGEPERDERLRELDFGALEGKRWGELSGEVQRALVGFDRFEAPGGESVLALRTRLSSFVHRLGGGRHLVFTHGGVIRCLLRDLASDDHVGPGGLAVVELPAGARLHIHVGGGAR